MKDTYKKSFILLVLFFGTTLLYSQAFISANEKQSNIEESKLNEMDIPQESYCNNLNYESTKLHTLKNIESIDVEIINNKEWNENLFRAIYLLKKTTTLLMKSIKKDLIQKLLLGIKIMICVLLILKSGFMEITQTTLM